MITKIIKMNSGKYWDYNCFLDNYRLIVNTDLEIFLFKNDILVQHIMDYLFEIGTILYAPFLLIESGDVFVYKLKPL